MPTIRLEEGLDGHGLTFEVVDEQGGSRQIEYMQEQIALAVHLGFDPETAEPHPEGLHGQAYDFLKQNIGKTFEVGEDAWLL